MDLSACLVRIIYSMFSPKGRSNHTHRLARVVILGASQSQMLRLSLGASAVLSRSQISILLGVT